MSRMLIVIGLVIVLAGVLWPIITRIGLGHLPGDLLIHRGNFTFYFPLVTSIVLSVVVSLIFWLFGR